MYMLVYEINTKDKSRGSSLFVKLKTPTTAYVDFQIKPVFGGGGVGADASAKVETLFFFTQTVYAYRSGYR